MDRVELIRTLSEIEETIYELAGLVGICVNCLCAEDEAEMEDE